MSAVLQGTLATGEAAFAVADPAARFVDGEVSPRRLGAFLRPFRSEEEATAALVAAGATDIRSADRRSKR